MAIPTIVVYSQSSNRNNLRLYSKDVPVCLGSVTKIEIRLDSNEAMSSEAYPTYISWSKSLSPNMRGMVYLDLGYLFWTTRTYTASLMVYDEVNNKGVFWGFFRIRAIEQEVAS